ncbi:hypothetical protein [Luteimonas sp. R10]|uniref:hypothetical protein n=1 Tax=Luteimonas sp. R10 TaxID=3108176 RepID=UPI00308C670D|nr:hypothetical protein U3649_15030 [Luteimonas sp. R10]
MREADGGEAPRLGFHHGLEVIPAQRLWLLQVGADLDLNAWNGGNKIRGMTSTTSVGCTAMQEIPLLRCA